MELKKVALNDIHIQLGGKMVPFAGYNMPVRYSSDIAEHKTVREAVGIFDVSHMGEFIIKGPHAYSLLQKTTSNDIGKLHIGQAQYAYLPNDKGGIVDDLLIYKIGEEEYMVVVNASNVEKDWDWFNRFNNEGATIKNISDTVSLFAVQGPKAAEALQSLTDTDLATLKYYTFKKGTFADVDDVIISATGYTGAGGFEIYLPNEHAENVWQKIMEAGAKYGIKPIGLGARDTLRMEMGYCLYGNEINDESCPLEAGLGWVTKFNKSFTNSDKLIQKKTSGIKRKLVGFILEEKGIPRTHYKICNAEHEIIGEVTSGTLSPTLHKGIGMGYVNIAHSRPDTEILIEIRNKLFKARVAKLPFI
ncbi:MAG: glycine cleavage system aminomethyltransferase GcvT [Bacteroidota bacterium]|nr:glycine cleavage system aminomethyltransferase GcvT [Bacteroidota bacterium]